MLSGGWFLVFEGERRKTTMKKKNNMSFLFLFFNRVIYILGTNDLLKIYI